MDLTTLLDDLNNHFEKEYQDGSFTIASNSVAQVRLSLTAGSYVRIMGSESNDGVHKVKSLIDGVMLIDGALTDESFTGTIVRCAVPSQVVALVSDITAYEKKLRNGVSSESIPNYSVTYEKKAVSEQFADVLSLYRKPDSGKESFRKWTTLTA